MWPLKKKRAFSLFLGFLSVCLSLLRRFCLVYFLTGVIGADVSGHGLICEGQPVTSRLAVICGTSSCHMGVSVPQRQGCHIQWRQSRAKYWTMAPSPPPIFLSLPFPSPLWLRFCRVFFQRPTCWKNMKECSLRAPGSQRWQSHPDISPQRVPTSPLKYPFVFLGHGALPLLI